MVDRGSFEVQSQALRAAADLWRTAAQDMGSAQTEIEPGVGGGDSFGVLAGSSGVEGHYNVWSGDMLAALQRAQANFEYLEAALDSTANDYDGVDSTVALDISKLDAMIDDE